MMSSSTAPARTVLCVPTLMLLLLVFGASSSTLSSMQESQSASASTSCTTAAQCSYNGECTNRACVCYPQWTGDHCAALNLVPAALNSGLHWSIDNQRVSTWGGSVLRDDAGIYHMYAAEMGYFCGINVWLSNSIVVHANASNPIGEYTRVPDDYGGTVCELFSHEPTAVRALDTGDYVLFVSNIDPPPTNVWPCDGCADGKSLDCDPYVPRNWDSDIPSKMTYSKTPYGPWSRLELIQTENPSIDSNFAPVIFKNGSLIGMARGDGFYVVTADNWKDTRSYQWTLSQVPKDCCGEDPFVWYDPNLDVLHCIWHFGGWDDPYGVHTYSTNGGVVWEGYPSVFAYGPVVEYTDGSSFSFQRMERPHLIMGADGFTPLALTNACEKGGLDLDHSYTCLRPLNQK